MRVFIVLGIISVCNAGQSGYQYGHPGLSQASLSHFSDTSSHSLNSVPAFSNRFAVGGIGGAGEGFGGVGGVGGIGGLGGISGLGGVGGVGGHGGVSSFDGFGGHGSGSFHREFHGGEPIVTKHFYFHSAPDEADEPIHKQIVLGAPRKNYRVVFIKAPSITRGSTRISVVPAHSEDKTVIYVLSKKHDASDIQADIQPTTHQHSKPEVYFIKYKTQEEAVQAQRQIQAQYDALGGTSQVSDEGVAPITSVVGSGEGPIRFNGVSSSHSSSVASGYLPPK